MSDLDRSLVERVWANSAAGYDQSNQSLLPIHSPLTYFQLLIFDRIRSIFGHFPTGQSKARPRALIASLQPHSVQLFPMRNSQSSQTLNLSSNSAEVRVRQPSAMKSLTAMATFHARLTALGIRLNESIGRLWVSIETAGRVREEQFTQTSAVTMPLFARTLLCLHTKCCSSSAFVR